MSDNWYKSPAWDPVAQTDFRTRLSRARFQKPYYLRVKAEAIAVEFPEASLALCDERIALGMALGDEHECSGAAYAKALIYLRRGRMEDAFAALEAAIGTDGLAFGAPAAGEYCCLVGYHGRSDLYARALGILDRLDTMAIAALGRPFSSFPACAGRAFIDYRSGRKSASTLSAKEALALALGQSSQFLGISNFGPAPRLPSPLIDALVVIAGLWDEVTLGLPPEV
jgi:tetratricopeptide (TPR) repeat protein